MYQKSDKIRKQFGENIRHLRMSRGYSQEKFAQLCGKSQAVISSWEIGIRQPELDVIFEVAEALHVPITSLIPVEANDTEEDVAKEIADMIHTDPQYRLFFDKVKKADPKKLHVVLSMLDAISFESEQDA